uniref:Uncharacterized protein n=1 Tax=Octopus bimaculoides TaxID=37653 RepID=A0A0L8G6D2_OCTBM
MVSTVMMAPELPFSPILNSPPSSTLQITSAFSSSSITSFDNSAIIDYPNLSFSTCNFYKPTDPYTYLEFTSSHLTTLNLPFLTIPASSSSRF